jgi:hypothetical protein
MPALALAEQTLGCGSSKDAMELVRAVRRALNEDPDLDSEALFALDDVRKHVATKPRRGSSKRKTTPAADRRGEYDGEKCGARIWLAVPGVKNTGYSDIQCSSSAVDGCFCKKHAKQESNGLLWCGLITETPPENPVKVEGNGNTKEMYWYKEEDGESSPAPSTKGQKPNKQSPPWKPAGANTEPSLEEQINAAKKKSPAKKSPAKKSPVKKKSPAKEEPEKEKKPRGRPKKKKDESPPEEEEKKPKKPKKSQAKEKVAKKSPAKEKVAKVDKELGEMDPSEMSMGQLQALMAAKKMMETVKDKDDDQLDEDNECASDDEDGLKEIDYEGIGYLMNCEMVVIDPVSMEEVGKWDTDDEEIEWIDDDAAEEHADRVANSDWNKL